MQTNMATTISNTSLVLSLRSTADLLGVSAFPEDLSTIITENKTVSVHKISDHQNTQSYTLKGDLQYTLPVVYDFEEKQFVGVVGHHDKTRLCSWSTDAPDYTDWKKKVMLDEIVEVIEVKDSEPIIVLENDTAFWFSHLEDPSYHFKLIPESLNKSETELSHFEAYKSGPKTELVYTILSEDKSYSCVLHFNLKQAIGNPTVIVEDKVSGICRCPGPLSVYIAATNDGKIIKLNGSKQETPTDLHKLNEDLQPHTCHYLDSDQILIGCYDKKTMSGVLLLYSSKFNVVQTLLQLSASLAGSKPVYIASPYILTQSEGRLEAHTCKLNKLTLRNMLGSMSLDPSNNSTPDTSVKDCASLLVKFPIKCSYIELDKELNKYDKKTLLEALMYYASHSCTKWSTNAVISLLKYLVIPSHLVDEVCKAAIRHKDKTTLDYLVHQCPSLPEYSVACLLSHYLSEVNDDERMDVDESSSSSLPQHLVPVVNTLLSKAMTDIFAAEALQQLTFSHVIVLLKYLASLFSDSTSPMAADDDDEVSFTPAVRMDELSNEQISRWCTVLLDAHYTQIILSDQAELLVNMHENISHMVELQSNVMKLGANLSYRPPEPKPSVGNYCIELVQFSY